MVNLRNLCLTFALVAVAGSTASAQVGKSQGVMYANMATEADIMKAPHMTAAIAKALIERRPFLDMTAFNTFMQSQGLNATQLADVYKVLFVPINLNTASDAEIMMVPGSGPRVLREFKEYRPYAGLPVFHREMRKYWDETEVLRLEQYVFVPINLNTATEADILTIPGSGSRMVREFMEYRPYDNMERFKREMLKYWDEKEVNRMMRYVRIN